MPAEGLRVNGTALRIIRERSGLSATRLAQQAEISPQFLSDLELGRRNASPEVLRRIADSLECPLIALLRDPGAAA
jgi:transcriptional regulator with XRE-family HTH domain